MGGRECTYGLLCGWSLIGVCYMILAGYGTEYYSRVGSDVKSVATLSFWRPDIRRKAELRHRPNICMAESLSDAYHGSHGDSSDSKTMSCIVALLQAGTLQATPDLFHKPLFCDGHTC